MPEETDSLPYAVEVAVTFFRAWDKGKVLYPEHFVWCADVDQYGDRVYVGGYRLGRVAGLQVHRHLQIRDRHIVVQAIPEKLTE